MSEMNLAAQSLGVSAEKTLVGMIQMLGQPLTILQRNNLMEGRGRSMRAALWKKGRRRSR